MGCHEVQCAIKSRARSNKPVRRREDAKNLQRQLPAYPQRFMDLSHEKGASTCLTALPNDNHGVSLHKSALRDALSLQYNRPLENSPSHCSCSHPFTVEHTLSGPTGRFPSIIHNEVGDIASSLLSDVCHDFSTEPHARATFIRRIPVPTFSYHEQWCSPG